MKSIKAKTTVSNHSYGGQTAQNLKRVLRAQQRLHDQRDHDVFHAVNYERAQVVGVVGRSNDLKRRQGKKSVCRIATDVCRDLVSIHKHLLVNRIAQRVLIILPPPSAEKNMPSSLSKLHARLQKKLPNQDTVGMSKRLAFARGYYPRPGVLERKQDGRYGVHLNTTGSLLYKS